LNLPINPTELAQLLDQYAAALELYASQWTTVAEDCVQEAFIELATQKNRPLNLVAWLYKVVRNKSLNAQRSDVRRVNRERLASMFAATVNRTNHLSEIEISQQREHLISSLEKLTTDDRELIVLRIWSQLTWQQIADLTGTSSSSACRNYIAALNKLKQILEPTCKTNLNSPLS